jgi:hypothetical protein
MAGQKITKRVIDSLKVEPSEYALWDAQLPGFAVRVRPTGAMSYIVLYGSGRGAPQRRYTIATVGKITPDKARERAKAILGAVAHGKDPAGEKAGERETPTVAMLAGRFLAEHVIAKRKPGTASTYRYVIDEALAVVASMYSFAVRAGLVPEGMNPARRIDKFAEHPHERFLTGEESLRRNSAVAFA